MLLERICKKLQILFPFAWNIGKAILTSVRLSAIQMRLMLEEFTTSVKKGLIAAEQSALITMLTLIILITIIANW
jgi:hypothetical protein